jgi:transcriptional regulator with GAF, ATPase, and Fis domain
VSDRRVRIGVALLLALAALMAWDASRGLESRRGRSYPGFYVEAGGLVAPSFRPAVRRTLTEAGLEGLDQIVSVEGVPVRRAREVWEAAERAGPGVPLRYGVLRPDGSTREVTVATRPLTSEEAPPLALFFAVGSLFLLIGAAPLLARPALAEARLFFLLCWALACNFGFLSADHLVLHRFQPWSFAVTTLALATLLHLAASFPEPRGPLRGPAARRVVAGWYAFSLLAFVAFAALYQREPLATYRAALASASLYAVGGLGLFANAAASWLRSREPVLRERARVVACGPVAAAVLAGAATGIAGWGLRDAAAAAFFAGMAALPPAIAWATFQHDLFDLDAVARRGLALGAAALLGSLAYLAGFSALQRLFGVETAWASAGLSLGLLFALVPLSQPFHRRLEGLLDRTLFPERVRARRRVREAALALARVRDPAGVAELVESAAREAFGAQRAELAAGAAGGPIRPLARAADAPELPEPLAAAVRRGQPLQREPLPGAGPRPARALQRSLEERGVDLLLPLPAHAGRAAALLLGPRAGGPPYGRDERALLGALAAQAALALRSAEAFEELAALQRRLQRANVVLRAEIARHHGFEELIGEAPMLCAAREQIAQVARTGASVLVLGETGTGKELAVRALHRLSERAERPLVKVACAAIPEHLVESELFGHERGAFTGAIQRRIGRLELADGGTLFLDDVDTLPLAAQAKLLRALQEGELQRLGSNETKQVDVRLVAATNRDLRAEVTEGRFREDLYYRLHVVPVRLPPLRERREDIPLLVQHFIETESERLGREVRPIDGAALEALCAYDWPGNVRELRNVIERAVVMSAGNVIRLAAELGARPRGAPAHEAAEDGRPLAERLRDFKRARLREALAWAGGNQTRAAERLGLHRQSFARMLRELDLHGAAAAPGARPPEAGR